MAWNCPLCYSFAAPTLKAVVRHVGAVHSHDAVFRVCCGLQGCPRTFRTFHAYKKHMYSKHRDLLELEVCPQHDQDQDGVQSPASVQSLEDNGYLDPDSSKKVNERTVSALFLMKTREVSKVSQVCLNGLVEDVTSLLQRKVQQLEADVTRVLNTKGVEVDSQLTDVFRQHEQASPFQGIETEFLQKKFYREEFGLVEAVERKLPQLPEVGSRSNYCVYEVPLLSSLKQFLSNRLILDEVLRGHRRTDDLLSDYCDGTMYQRHPLFSLNPSALQIMLYYDDVEVCNPLGSRAKTHKLAIFYYTLGNISPKYRSTLPCIQLLSIVKSSVLQTCGPDVILETFMDDLQCLEQDDGVTLEIDGQQYTFRGTLTLVPADNLASQYLGGYKSLSAALRKCRHCMAVDADMQQQFFSEAFHHRSRESHAMQCASLGGALHAHFSTTYGLQRDSILNRSQYFHVTEGLIPDAMHDVLEGILPLETKELLKHHIGAHTFSLADLNDAIQKFPYAASDARNKPAPISSKTLSSNDHALKQTATQMWCLARLLPLLVGEKIDKQDQYWSTFVLLLTIVDYVLSPTVSKDSIAYLRVLIDEHHQSFKDLYPHCRLTPKMHYLIHYPEFMNRYGPLVRCWCMRFEGKHNYFKDLAHRVKSFKNIPKTMATRHQHLMAYYAASGDGNNPFCKDATTGTVSETIARAVEYKDELLDAFVDIADDTNIIRLSWVQVGGSTYHFGDVVVLKYDLLPTFGVIHDLIVFDVTEFFIVAEVLITQCFVDHYHSFEVSKQPLKEYSICPIKDLIDHHVLGLYNIADSFFVPLKYYLVENI